jgi:hypothetical protein
MMMYRKNSLQRRLQDLLADGGVLGRYVSSHLVADGEQETLDLRDKGMVIELHDIAYRLGV